MLSPDQVTISSDNRQAFSRALGAFMADKEKLEEQLRGEEMLFQIGDIKCQFTLTKPEDVGRVIEILINKLAS